MKLSAIARAEDIRPICAVCGHRVDELDIYEDLVLRTKTFTARCHGETEMAVIYDEDMYAMMRTGQSKLVLGPAFATPKAVALLAEKPNRG